jgi:hypothetical protein
MINFETIPMANPMIEVGHVLLTSVGLLLAPICGAQPNPWFSRRNSQTLGDASHKRIFTVAMSSARVTSLLPRAPLHRFGPIKGIITR